MNRKAIFDRVRQLLGRSFRQEEVRALDEAIDDALSSRGQTTQARTISAAGLALIKEFEGCSKLRPDGMVQAYPDPGTGGAPWTIGWGATGRDIGPETVWTRRQCDERLAHDLQRYASETADAIGDAPTTQPQFDALTSFHYNTGAIGRATLTRLHREGRHDLALQEFARWKFAGGRVLKGLVRRRAAEAALYASD